jgi:glycosyltransferase involved in cell wall biosynthesis
MASGTPVVVVPDPALVEVAGDAAVVVDEARLADGIRQAVAESERLRAAGLARASTFSWERTAEATVQVYLEALAA